MQFEKVVALSPELSKGTASESLPGEMGGIFMACYGGAGRGRCNWELG